MTFQELIFKLQQYWADEIKEQSMEIVVDGIKRYLKDEGIEELYISFDIDALDASVAASTGTPEPGGLSVAECLYAINRLSQTLPLTGADLVEVAPMIGDKHAQESTLHAAKAVAEAFVSAMISA